MFLVIERRVGSRIRKLCHLAKNNDRERRTSIMIVCVCGYLKLLFFHFTKPSSWYNFDFYDFYFMPDYHQFLNSFVTASLNESCSGDHFSGSQ